MRFFRPLSEYFSAQLTTWKPNPATSPSTILMMKQPTMNNSKHHETTTTTTELLWESPTLKCSNCRHHFSFWHRRKHHCRLCQEAVCETCSLHLDFIPEIHTTQPVRLCDRCYERQHSTPKDVRRTPSSSSLTSTSSTSYTSPSDLPMALHEQQTGSPLHQQTILKKPKTCYDLRVMEQSQPSFRISTLNSAARLIQKYLDFSYDLKHDHRHFVRSEIINWFVDTKFAEIREDASRLFFALVQKRFLIQLPAEQGKKISSLYRLNMDAIHEKNDEDEPEPSPEMHESMLMKHMIQRRKSAAEITTRANEEEMKKYHSAPPVLQNLKNSQNRPTFRTSTSMPLPGRQKLPPKMVCKTQRCWNCHILFLPVYNSSHAPFCSIDCKTNTLICEQDTKLASELCHSTE